MLASGFLLQEGPRAHKWFSPSPLYCAGWRQRAWLLLLSHIEDWGRRAPWPAHGGLLPTQQRGAFLKPPPPTHPPLEDWPQQGPTRLWYRSLENKVCHVQLRAVCGLDGDHGDAGVGV